MKTTNVLKSSQEQAVGAWIDYLNQVRIDQLLKALSEQDVNLTDALSHIEWAVSTIGENIIERNRGGEKGMHGFIAEIAECGIGNARERVAGQAATHVWIDDNGPSDILRGATEIQQKFVQSGGHLSLKAVLEHLEHYPDYIANGHKYQIPKDHYDKIMEYLSMPEDVANKLPTSNGEFSRRQWEEVHKFFERSGVSTNDLEPSILSYDQVQKGSIGDALDQEKDNLREQDELKRKEAYEDSKPALSEGLKATAVGAAVEGTTDFALAIFKKRKSGKKIKDFSTEDWSEIGLQTGKGAIRGGVRGAAVYTLTNFTATPGAVASAVVTAGFGVAQQVHRFRNGAVSELELIENAEIICLDASVSALSTLIGQIAIPVPILGAIIGNSIGMMLYNIGKDAFNTKEKEIINQYLKEINTLDGKLSAEYATYVESLTQSYAKFLNILTSAFSTNAETAFNGSIALALEFGVSSNDILDSYSKITSYFTE